MRTRKQNITFREAMIISSKHFNPLRLSSFLKDDKGNRIVDKNKAIQSTNEEQAFFWLLNQEYRWNYIVEREDITLYMDVEEVETEEYKGKTVYIGLYNEQNHEKLNRILAVSLFPARLSSRYIYTEEKMNEIIKNIR